MNGKTLIDSFVIIRSSLTRKNATESSRFPFVPETSHFMMMPVNITHRSKEYFIGFIHSGLRPRSSGFALGLE
jgi:hypothetical protein